jgi:Spy/CpxP family protein refolding chaperone
MKREMRGGPGGMHRGGFGINDEELAKLNLTNDQKVKLFDFRIKMIQERGAMMKDRKPGEGMKPEGINPEEMRQLMSAKMLGTLTPEQKAKLDQIEAKRKEMMEKRKTEMQQRRTKMEQTHQEFLNIFTLDQRKQLEQIRNERARQMQERMKQREPRKGPGGPPPVQPKPNN